MLMKSVQHCDLLPESFLHSRTAYTPVEFMARGLYLFTDHPVGAIESQAGRIEGHLCLAFAFSSPTAMAWARVSVS
jgi:hypothetical protein